MAIESLYSNELDTEEIEQAKQIVTKSFWGRQFQTEATYGQKYFDWIFGVILPVVCFFFDPIIFRTFSGTPLAGQYKPFAYLLSFFSIISLMAFMIWGAKLKWLNGFLSGLFAAGAFVSLVVGIAMIPISLVGLIVLIGVLGFTPLFTFFVYWRNSVRAYKFTEPLMKTNLIVKSIILTAMFSLITPAIINIKIQKGLKTMQYGNAAEIRRTTKRLKFVTAITDFSSLHSRYNYSDSSRYNYSNYGDVLNSEESKALTESYKMLTGKEINQ